MLGVVARMDGTPFPSTARLTSKWLLGRVPRLRRAPAPVDMETAYCAEIVAVSYQAMGLLPAGQRPNWYDAGRFWSGDELRLADGARLSSEISVRIPPGTVLRRGALPR